MASRLTKALVLGLAVIVAPLATGPAMAGGVAMLAEPTPAEALSASIGAAVAAAKADPGYAALSPAQKVAAIQQAVAGALAAAGTVDAATVLAALNAAVASGAISGAMAVQVAATVSSGLANQVAAAQGLTITGSTGAIGAPSVLVSLASAAGGAPPAPGAPPAAFDPCAGVVATYCGT